MVAVSVVPQKIRRERESPRSRRTGGLRTSRMRRESRTRPPGAKTSRRSRTVHTISAAGLSVIGRKGGGKSIMKN